jgi:hypothetical protein
MQKLLISTLIFLLIASNLLMIESASAKPAVPEFSIKVIDNSYYMPATTPVYRADPYTGERILIEEGHEGYPVQNGTIDLTIHTQRFTSYYNSADHLIRLYFRIAYKGHFETSWNYYLPYSGYYGNDSQYLQASADGTSRVQFGFGHFSFVTGEYRSIAIPPSFGEIKDGGQIDFKVEAFIGYSNKSEYVTAWGLKSYDAYIGESSGWSPTQTIIPAGSNTTTDPQSSTTASTPTSPDTNTNSITLPLDTFIVIIAVVAVTIVALSVLAFRRHRKTIDLNM